MALVVNMQTSACGAQRTPQSSGRGPALGRIAQQAPFQTLHMASTRRVQHRRQVTPYPASLYSTLRDALSHTMVVTSDDSSHVTHAPVPDRNRQGVVTQANVLQEVLMSAPAGAAAALAATFTSNNRLGELQHLRTTEGLAPIGAAVLVDAMAHSLPFIGPVISLVSEQVGAAAGVAYVMTIILSSPTVDPKTMAPGGTILNAKTAKDARAAVRVPFTQILPTTMKVVDKSNSGSSGAGWAPGEDGLPSLPISTVVGVIGVGCIILEVIAHAPVLSLFFPRVLQVAGFLALAGSALDKRAA